jgi:hypothetical protein
MPPYTVVLDVFNTTNIVMGVKLEELNASGKDIIICKDAIKTN